MIHSLLIGRTVAYLFLPEYTRTYHKSHTVAISRAKEGLFILGNSSDLSSRSDMWRSIIEELERDQAIVEAFPISCQRHPGAVKHVSKPGELPLIAPDGNIILSYFRMQVLICLGQVVAFFLVTLNFNVDTSAHTR